MDAVQSLARGLLTVRNATGGVSPATWGQTLICDDLESYGAGAHHFNIPGSVLLSEPTDRMRVVNALESVMLENESLRSNFEKEEWGWRQIVRPYCQYPIDERQAPPHPDDLQLVVDDLARDLNATTYDLPSDGPARFGLIMYRSTVVAVAYSLSHSAVDAVGSQLFKARFLARLQGRGTKAVASTSTTIQTPRQEADFQSSAEGRRIHEQAMKHWLRTMEEMPPSLGVTGEEQFYDLRLTSGSLLAHARTVARAHGTTPSTVLLAAAARASQLALGEESFRPQVSVSNRFRLNIKNLIAPVSMEGILSIPTPLDYELPELVTLVSGATLKCYRASYFDKREMLINKAELERVRGSEIDVSRWYNDMHTNAGPQHRASEFPLKLSWEKSPNKPLDVTYAMGIRGGNEVTITLTADTGRISRDAMEAFLLEIESFIAWAART